MFSHIHTLVRTDRRGVSPVIGVVMMVAITVILTGIIAAFVLGFGAGADAPPQASLAIDSNDSDELVLTHSGGEPIELDELYLRGDIDEDGSVAELTDGTDRLHGGESVAVALTDPPEAGATINLVWDIGDDAATIAEYHWPST